MENLLDYRKSVFSCVLGEDGIINHIFSKIKHPEFKGICAEFGAHNGVFNSNTRNLILNHGWKSLQIESDPIKSEECKKNYLNYPVTTVCCQIDYNKNGKNSFDQIALKNGFNHFNFISIDVDGLDYEMFESIELLPDVLLVEVQAGSDQLTHQKVPIEIAKKDRGQGLTVMTDLANAKGYELVAYTGNAFYVKKEYYSLLNINDNSPETIFRNFWNIRTEEDKTWLKNNCIRLGIHNPLMI
jgi:hypothetical protein